MDPFKKYLFNRRDELDVEKPPSPELWQRIQQHAQPVRPLRWKWAAAACLILLAGMAVYWFGSTASDKPAVAINPPVKADTSLITATPATDKKRAAVDSMAVKKPEILVEEKDIKKPRSINRLAGPKKKSPIDMLEQNYATIINYQLKKLERTPIYAESAGYFHVFKKQWYDLEKDETTVRQDVEAYGLSDQHIEQLILLYQQKMGLLKQLQTEINKMNNHAKQRTVIQKKKPAYLIM